MPTAGPGKQMWKRMVTVMLAMIILTVSVTSVSLFNIMVLHGQEYQSKASEQQLHDAYIAAERGNIYDSNMNTLAKSATVWTVYVTPNDIANLKNDEEKGAVKALICEKLAPILGLESDEVAKKLEKTKSYYVELKKKCNDETVEKVRAFLKENSKYSLSSYIGIDQSTTRYYPENIAATVLGFVGDDNQGLYGLELQYEEELTGGCRPCGCCQKRQRGRYAL